MSTLKISNSEPIDIRASMPLKQLRQAAARACHKKVSELLLDASVTGDGGLIIPASQARRGPWSVRVGEVPGPIQAVCHETIKRLY